MKHPYPLIGLTVIAVLLLIGVIVWAVLAPNGGCPRGQQQHLVSEVPMLVGKVVVMMPVYSCES